VAAFSHCRLRPGADAVSGTAAVGGFCVDEASPSHPTAKALTRERRPLAVPKCYETRSKDGRSGGPDALKRRPDNPAPHHAKAFEAPRGADLARL
jgi:hypothetical protein